MSFLNIDVKILSWTAVNITQPCMKSTVRNKQVGFIPRVQGWFNIGNC
jgi:hypothetical protein